MLDNVVYDADRPAMPRRSGSDRADCQGVRDDDGEGADGADDICAYVTFLRT